MKKRYLLFILMFVLMPSIVLAGGGNEDTSTPADLNKDVGICVYESNATLKTRLEYSIYKKDGAISLNNSSCTYFTSNGKAHECNIDDDLITVDYFVQNNQTYCPDTMLFSIQYSMDHGSWYVIGEHRKNYAPYVAQKVSETNMDIQGPNVAEPTTPANPHIPILNYNNLCSRDNAGVEAVFKMIGYIVQILRWIVPIILIIMGILDFSKAAISGDDKAINVAGSAFLKRIVIAVSVFLVPSVIMALLNLVEGTGITEDSRFISCSEIIFNVFGS